MEELCIDGSRRRVVAWAKCIQDDLKIQLRVYRTNRNQTYRHSNYTASLHSLWVTYHCFPDTLIVVRHVEDGVRCVLVRTCVSGVVDDPIRWQCGRFGGSDRPKGIRLKDAGVITRRSVWASPRICQHRASTSSSFTKPRA